MVSLLTKRQQEILDLLAIGMTDKEIAKELGICPPTVKSHIYLLFEKINVHSRTDAALLVADEKLEVANSEIERLRKLLCGLQHELEAVKFYANKMSASIEELGDLT